jgi:hypothetical protein
LSVPVSVEPPTCRHVPRPTARGRGLAGLRTAIRIGPAAPRAGAVTITYSDDLAPYIRASLPNIRSPLPCWRRWYWGAYHSLGRADTRSVPPRPAPARPDPGFTRLPALVFPGVCLACGQKNRWHPPPAVGFHHLQGFRLTGHAYRKLTRSSQEHGGKPTMMQAQVRGFSSERERYDARRRTAGRLRSLAPEG